MSYEWPGYFLVVVVGLLIVAGPLCYFFPRRLRNLIIIAFVVRGLGTLLRHWVIYDYYNGGDAMIYFQMGAGYADQIWNFDFSFLQPSEWIYGQWWGTQGVLIISGFVVSMIGPTVRGEFLFFSLLALCGLLLFCKCFKESFPRLDPRKYAMWILLWPSLWFWTSSVGKDALILFAAGLVVYGYAGKTDKIQWFSLLFGLTLTALIRPHVAGVLVVSITMAHWITPGTRWTAAHWLQGFGIIILTALVVQYGLSNLGIEQIDVDSIREYIDDVSQHSAQGGSEIQAPGFVWWGIPVAFANILFRPFLWEVSNPLVGAAALEMMVFWIVFFIRRRRILAVARQWRSIRLLRLAIPLTILYVLMMGLAVSNLGIIARQRIHIMPLLLIWLEAYPNAAAVPETRKKRRLVPVPSFARLSLEKPRPGISQS